MEPAQRFSRFDPNQSPGARIEPAIDNFALTHGFRVRLFQKELYFAKLRAWVIGSDKSARLVPEEISILPLKIAAKKSRATTPVCEKFVGAGPQGQ